MSQENVERVRAGFDAYNGGDLDALLEVYDPAVEIVTLLEGTHHGKAAMRQLFEENRRNMPGFRLDPEEVIDAGDEVIALVRQGGAGRVSHIGLDDLTAILFTIKKGLVVRVQAFRNRADAFEAAGLRE